MHRPCWPLSLKRFPLWPFKKKFADPWFRSFFNRMYNRTWESRFRNTICHSNLVRQKGRVGVLLRSISIDLQISSKLRMILYMLSYSAVLCIFSKGNLAELGSTVLCGEKLLILPLKPWFSKRDGNHGRILVGTTLATFLTKQAYAERWTSLGLVYSEVLKV